MAMGCGTTGMGMDEVVFLDGGGGGTTTEEPGGGKPIGAEW